jgi:hypothetical protein
LRKQNLSQNRKYSHKVHGKFFFAKFAVFSNLHYCNLTSKKNLQLIQIFSNTHHNERSKRGEKSNS